MTTAKSMCCDIQKITLFLCFYAYDSTKHARNMGLPYKESPKALSSQGLEKNESPYETIEVYSTVGGTC